MAAPSTTGMGQGAAQVFDTSGLAHQYGQAKILDEQQKAAQKKDEEKRLAELLGAGGDLFKEKYYATRDDATLRERYNKDILGWMKGKEKAIIDPTSPEAQEYKSRMQNLLFDFKMSEESKNLAQNYIQDVAKNTYDYEPESLQYIQEFQNTPLAVFDPSKIKKVNNFDLLSDFDKKNNEFIQEVKNRPTNLGVFDTGNGFYGQGSKTVASEQDRQNHMENVFKSWSTNAQAMDKLNRMYGDQAQQEGRDVVDVAWESLYPKTAINITDISYGKDGGEGKEEPFNPNNIIEDVTIKTGGDTSVGNDPFFSEWIDKVKIQSTPTRMYQTKPIDGLVAISNKAINMSTGKPTESVGSYKVKMGSPMNYKGSLYVPAISDMGESLLIPAEEVQEVYKQKGYDMPSIATGVGVKNFGGSSTNSTYTIKKGDTKTLSSGRKVVYNGTQWVAE